MTKDREIGCYIDEEQVDCETWGGTLPKEAGDEIESSLDFLSLIGEQLCLAWITKKHGKP